MRSSGFKFIDLPTAAERLGITRNQLLQWVSEGRIKPFSGTGQQSVFRATDIEKLADQLGPNHNLTQHSALSTQHSEAPQGAEVVRTRRRDAIKLMGTRLSMDSRWAEISDKDIATWLDALEPVQFERIRKVADLAIERLQKVQTMLDEQERKLGKSHTDGGAE